MQTRTTVKFWKRPGPILGLWLLLLAGGPITASGDSPSQLLNPQSLQWPRFFSGSGYEFAVYQPQISQWPGNQIDGRFVAAVRPAGASNETYGVVFFTARTDVDKVNRLVTLEDFQVTRVEFPTQKSLQPTYEAVIQHELPNTAKTIPLDHLEAVFAASADIAKVRTLEVNNTPPRIIYTTLPSILVLVEGQPVLQPAAGAYERVVNTRSLVLCNTNASPQVLYLYAADHCYTSQQIDGPWSATDPPVDIEPAYQAALATRQVDLLVPQKPPSYTLNVIVSTVPAELLQSSGAANLLSVPDTSLLYVANSQNAIFYCLDDADYYVLISGRWFKSQSLDGSWAFVPPGQLPSDFSKIPPGGPKAAALASVAGTPQAQEAVIANSIPQTATINRNAAELTVNYVRAPSFQAIPGTPLSYAVNTQTPVIMVGPTTYCACQGGVWFNAASASGPWTVATSVPPVIYTIPPSCPIYYVTYVYVYGSTPDYVYAGYTPGYAGTVVVPGDVVVYGTGWYYPPVIAGGTYIGYPPTYGYGAALAVTSWGGFTYGYTAGAYWGCWTAPYWGCYAWHPYSDYGYAHANVNACNFYTAWGSAVHATGSYGYNPYTGARWGSQHASAYNPYTGGSGYASRAGGYNPYSGNYAGGREVSGYNPVTGRYGESQATVSGNVYNGTASVSRQGYVANPRTGNEVSWNNGSLYSDNSGNVYKYDPGYGWEQYNNGSWQYAHPTYANSYANSYASAYQRADNWQRSGGWGEAAAPAPAAPAWHEPAAVYGVDDAHTFGAYGGFGRRWVGGWRR